MHTPTRLFLLRHGEVEDRYHRVFGGGRIDMELSPQGHEQARHLAGFLAGQHVDALYVSPMKRAVQTLEPILANHVHEPEIVSGLREVDFGDWTGLSWDGVLARYQVSAFQWLHLLEAAEIPNGESGRQLRDRVEPALRAILAAQPGKTAAIICHGGVIRMILSILLDLPLPRMSAFEIDYASVTTVAVSPGKTEVHLMNFAPWRHQS